MPAQRARADVQVTRSTSRTWPAGSSSSVRVQLRSGTERTADAVYNHDLPVIQALAMLIAGLYVVLNLLADVATILVTPKLRTRL
jgi:hypothetical protein